MRRRYRLLHRFATPAAAFLALAGAMTLYSASGEDTASRPNIVVILCDDKYD